MVRIKKIEILAVVCMILVSCETNPRMEKPSNVSFNEIRNISSEDIGKPIFFESSDGIRLAYFNVKPTNNSIANLVFIHGGGAYSEAGYQNIGIGLANKYNVSVYLLDLRGHGYSEGNRGDAPSESQVWKDIKLFLQYVKNNNETIPLYLGGHSSGGGLILNYDTWYSDENIDGYIFISPEFGYKSNTGRNIVTTNESANIDAPFVEVVLYPFILNGMTFGLLFGHTPSVFFNYPEKVREEKSLLLKYITCNMSKSMTPDNPQKQFAKISKPFILFVGENDELFDPTKVIQYLNFVEDNSIKEKSKAIIVSSENHLSILLNSDKLIGNEILNIK